MTNRPRSSKGSVPIHIPLLIFLYTLVFLVSVEFVMLFWLQTSLNTAARQIAIAAATNTAFPVEDVRNRCVQAARDVNAVGPGYHTQVREEYVRGLETGMKNYNIADFDPGMGDQANGAANTQETLRNRLSEMGALIPEGGFWRGAGSNVRNGGCFALRNPVTKQVTFYTVIHSGCTWPVFLKGFFNLTNRMSGTQGNVGGLNGMDSHVAGVTQRGGAIQNQGFCGWLEGRGAYAAKASGVDAIGVNRSLLTTGVRPCVFCTQNNCDYDGRVNQTQIINGGVGQTGTVTGQTGVAKPYDSYSQTNENRPRPNTTIIGTGQRVYAIDQWPQVRGGYCERCQEPCKLYDTREPGHVNHKYCPGMDEDPAGIRTIVNCGDIDPLIIVGLRYACQGEMYPDGRMIPTEVLGRCDHYFRVIPCGYPDRLGVSMPNVAGDVTNLDGRGNPIIVRRQTGTCTDTQVICRNDSVEVRPWVGPFWAIGAKVNGSAEEMHNLIEENYNNVDNPQRRPQDIQQNPLANPLDQLIPYNQVCDVCNPGSPKCGFFGTCKNNEDYWKEARVVIRGQWWTNTSFYELNPMYFELECKYRRDCQLQHCCWGVWNSNPQELTQYCSARDLSRRVERSPNCGRDRWNEWTYEGFPNATAEDHTWRTLPRDGNFPQCSTDAVKRLDQKVGECCGVHVARLRCGSEGCCPQFLPTPPELLPAPQCVKCNGANPNQCKIRCNKKQQYGGIGFCPDVECFRLKGKCPNRKPICRYGKCKVPPTVTTTTTTSGTVIIIGPMPPIIIDRCYYNCGPRPPKPTPSSSSSSSSSGGDCQKKCELYYSPLVVSLDGTDILPSGKTVEFKLDPNLGLNKNTKSAWIKGQKGHGFLAVDKNGNGIIDDGRELFGNFSGGKSYEDGYKALIDLFDANEDKVITGKELQEILFWEDLNEDGISQKEEISKLVDRGVTKIDAKNVSNTKLILGSGIYAKPHNTKGVTLEINNKESTGKSWDVWLKADVQKSEETSSEVKSSNLWKTFSERLVAMVEDISKNFTSTYKKD